MRKQAGEQRGVGARLQAEKQVGVTRSVGPSRVDHDNPRAALLLVGKHALEQHRVTPCRVGANENQKIGFVQILIAAGYGVGAEGPAMARDRGGHAQARIGIDVGTADETLHQLVGDVIILGQQLSGKIERDGSGAVARNDVAEPMRDVVERIRPGDPLHRALAAADHRIEQAAGKPQRLSER